MIRYSPFMRFGAHVSIEGGIENAPQRAHGIGCECFQMFTRSPHGGASPEVTSEKAKKFKKECKKYELTNYYIHTPYYINLASQNNRIYYGSISAVRNELIVADQIGAAAVITHLGSARELGKEEAGRKLAEGLVKIFRFGRSKAKDAEKEMPETEFKAKLLLEITAGAGEIMGDTFEEMAYFISEAEKSLKKNVLGVCFDTCHAFASGYDLRSASAVKKTFDKFDKIIGFERMGLIHCNDSMSDLSSHVDRHDNIGNGKIGLDGFRAILSDSRLQNMDFIVETPLGRDKKEVSTLKSLRSSIFQRTLL